MNELFFPSEPGQPRVGTRDRVNSGRFSCRLYARAELIFKLRVRNGVETGACEVQMLLTQ